MILDAGLLRGWPKERAELYGKPHLGARYTHDTAYEPTQARCAVCGRRASNCHHVARRSWGKTFRLVTPNGVWELRSPLFALCGSGTTGSTGSSTTAASGPSGYGAPGRPRRHGGPARC